MTTPDTDIVKFHEQDDDGQARNGPRHWHLFDIIARRRTPAPR